MTLEKLVVELGIDTSKMNKGLDEVQAKMKQLEAIIDKVSLSMNSIGWNTKNSKDASKLFNLSELRNELSQLQKQLAQTGDITIDDELVKKIRQAFNIDVPDMGGQIKEAANATSLLHKEWDFTNIKTRAARKALDKYLEQARKANGWSVQQMQDWAATKGYKWNGNNPSGGDGKLGNSVKDIVKALLGIRSIYMLVRKLISNNENITTAIDNLIGTVSNALEPLLNLLAAAIQWVAQIIASIFKVNVGISKSSDKTAKNTASFDEINNIDTSSSSGSSEVKIPTLKEVWESLKKFREDLGEVAGWLDLIVVTLGTIATIKAFDKIKTSILDLFASIKKGGKDLLSYLGFASWGELAAYGGIAAIFVGYAKYYDENKEAIDEWSKNADEKITEAVKSIGKSLKQSMEDFKAWATKVKESLTNSAREAIEKLGEWKQGYKDWARESDKTITNFLVNSKNNIVNKWNEIKTSTSDLWNSLWTGAKTGLDNIGNTIKTKFKSIINNYIVEPINKVINWINSHLRISIDPIVIAGKTIFSGMDKQLFTIPTITKLATGTNYVPQDMMAMLHKGEAVVPAKYNDNNAETNSLLRQLISVVDSKEFKAYISNKEVGKAAVNYINQQSRLMGGSLI